MFSLIAQAPPPSGGPSAGTVFYLSLIFIFVTAIITTVVTKWAKDKCLKFFNGYHCTVERTRGQTTWGELRVFSSGIEIIYDHAYVDSRGHKKTSYLLYQPDIDAQLLTLFRYHNEMNPDLQKRRLEQVHKTFNPGATRRFFRKIRNFVNTLRDAFNAALGTVIGQYQRMNPTSTILSTQGTQVTQIGQTLLGKFANAYEPLLEQYIGQPVILEIVDSGDPNHIVNEFTGYLADYTQNYVAVFNVEHRVAEEFELGLPDIQQDDAPAANVPIPPSTPAAPMKQENGMSIRIEERRMKIQNTSVECVIVRQLLRQGLEAVDFGVIIPPGGVLDLAARDARNGRLTIRRVTCLDIVAPRKYAIVHHAGSLLPRPKWVDELPINPLPLVPKFFAGSHEDKDGQQTDLPNKKAT